MSAARNVYRKVTGHTLAPVKENMSQKSHAPKRWPSDFDFKKKDSGCSRCKLFTSSSSTVYLSLCLLSAVS